jgi:hypothetical protein
MQEAAKNVPLADERLDPQSFIQKLKYQLSRECLYGSLRAREKVAAIERGVAERAHQESRPGPGTPTETPNAGGSNDRSRGSEMNSQEEVQQTGSEKNSPNEKSVWTDKHIETATKLVSEKHSVSVRHAAQFLNCSVHHVRRLASQNKLISSGTRPRQITSASLQAYKWPKPDSTAAAGQI